MSRSLHRCPTLVIAALDDRITPPYFSRALAQAIPGASGPARKAGATSLFIVEPDRYGQIVLGFLSEL
jgi:pimeloyl-ACP methyl ester carboxylesterase